MKRFYLLAVLGLFVSGCPQWSLISGKYVESSENYEVDLLKGWRKQNLHSDFLRLTKDGASLQQIGIGRRSIDKDLPHTKKKLSAGMLPQEVAELIIDDLRSNSDLMNFEAVENTPAKVGGHPGFKIVYRYQTKAGLRKKVVYYGSLVDRWQYYVFYEAAESYYFAKDQEFFERVKETFRITRIG